MAAGAAVATVVGTGISLVGQHQAAKAEEAAARFNANQKRIQALELLERFEINSATMRGEAELLKAQQQTSFASKGIDVGSGSALSVIEETNSMTARQIILDRREAEFKAEQIRLGASNDESLASDLRRANNLRMAGTFLSGAGQAASSAGSGSN